MLSLTCSPMAAIRSPTPGSLCSPAVEVTPEAVERRVGSQPGEVGTHGSAVLLDGHGVVVENDQQRSLQMAGVI